MYVGIERSNVAAHKVTFIYYYTKYYLMSAWCRCLSLRCLSAWCRFVLDDLWNAVVSFQTTQFAYRKGLGTCDALLSVSHTLQSTFESGQEARIIQIDFSAAFDRVNHQGILYKLCSVDIGGSLLSILTQFLSD